MAYPYGHTGSRAGSKTPGNVSPWIKIQLGWLTPIPIESDGTYPITPSLTTRQVYIISDPYPEGEYLLIENRQPLRWDSELKGSGGVVIWSIDDSIEGNTASGQEVVVVQADGLFDLENKRNFGDEGDFFISGRELGPTGDVSTKSRRTGATTGFTISGFSESSNAMSFTVSVLAPLQATTPAPTPAPILQLLLRHLLQHLHRHLLQHLHRRLLRYLLQHLLQHLHRLMCHRSSRPECLRVVAAALCYLEFIYWCLLVQFSDFSSDFSRHQIVFPKIPPGRV
jgi:hypothetical protein